MKTSDWLDWMVNELMRTINSQFREKILAMDSSELRSKYFRPDEGMRVYHISRSTIMNWAEKADALYCTGKMCLIDKEKFEESFERFRVTKRTEKQS